MVHGILVLLGLLNLFALGAFPGALDLWPFGSNVCSSLFPHQ